MGAMALGLAVLVWILVVLFSNGLAAIDWNILTQDTPAPGTEGGGLRNAVLGSLMMVGLAAFVATPIGIICGHVPDRVRGSKQDGRTHAFRHRHHVVSALDRHWSVCLCDRGGHSEVVFRDMPAAWR